MLLDRARVVERASPSRLSSRHARHLARSLSSVIADSTSRAMLRALSSSWSSSHPMISRRPGVSPLLASASHARSTAPCAIVAANTGVSCVAAGCSRIAKALRASRSDGMIGVPSISPFGPQRWTRGRWSFPSRYVGLHHVAASCQSPLARSVIVLGRFSACVPLVYASRLAPTHIQSGRLHVASSASWSQCSPARALPRYILC